MNCFMGIDSGTSGVKAVIINEKGGIEGIGYHECDVTSEQPGWADQDPMDWWKACDAAVKQAVEKSGCGKDVVSIGFSGQMQGNVMLDKDGKPLDNCMIWLDQRANEEVAEIRAKICDEEALSITTSYCLNSYWAPKILWIKKHRPEVYEKTAKVVFTKDFLRYMMTGEIATEVSDASLTYFMDVPNRCWSQRMLDVVGIPKEILPDRLVESAEIVGHLKEDIAAEWGLNAGIPVAAGAGDQPACGVGTGIVGDGVIGSSIGTSGVVFGCSDKPFVIKKECGTFDMCHAVPDKWCFLGLALTSGASFKWLRDNIFADKKHQLALENVDIYDYMTSLAEQAKVGSSGLIFLPYLNGDKTPNNDENARAVWFGLSQRHGINEVCRSVMEGVTYSLRDTVELFRENGLEVKKVVASGGGAKSQLWKQMQADIYNATVVTTNMEEGPAAGGAILGAVGAGYFGSIQEACDTLLEITSETQPIPENVKIYNEYYEIYRNLYGTLKDSFKKNAEIVNKYGV